MEYVIGIIVGCSITALAMLLNSFLSSRSARAKEQREYMRKNADKYISDLERTYLDALYMLDTLIRGEGRAAEDRLEEFYKLRIQLNLKSNAKIHSSFEALVSKIVDMSENLPSLQEELIPHFEDDYEREARLERRKKAEQKRSEAAKPYIGNLRKSYRDLSNDMEKHLTEIKGATLQEANIKRT